jgi:hypothetical protein
MDALLAILEASAPAHYLRGARWGYAAVNGLHILGIAMLVGAILPLDLRLLGLWRGTPVAALARVLVPVAATGLALAVTAGLLLFSIRAREYADLGIFQLKMALVAIGATSAFWLHWSHGLTLVGAGRGGLAVHGVISLACWLAVLACGRLIAFMGD